jgi:hypothetical protein
MATVSPTDEFYSPLSTPRAIRLVELLAGHPSDPIRVSLLSFQLNLAPTYDALSYVWGDSSDRATISCNDKPFSITANLHWALRRARLPDESRFIWADAISINQHDLRERSEQVAFMGRIYRRAEQVLICMGEAPDPSGAENVLALLEECAARGVRTPMEEWPGCPPKDPIRTAPQWHSLAVLMRRPWFRRAWVLQEVGMAQHPVVLYGPVRFPYRELMAMVRWVRRFGWSIKYNIGVWAIHVNWLDWSENWRESSSEEYTLHDLLDHAALLSCQDLRDHVYAFLGHPLAQKGDGSGPLIKPDYTKSVLEIYQEVTVLLLQMVGLKVLVTVEHTEESLADGFPSWVVRWYISAAVNNISCLPSQAYHAGGLVADGPPPLVEGAYLMLRGIHVDIIIKSFRIAVSYNHSRLVFTDVENTGPSLGLLEMIDFLFGWGTPSAYGHEEADKLRAFAAVICPSGSNIDLDIKVSGLEHCAMLHQRLREGAQLDANHPEVETALSFFRSTAHMCAGRNFIITNHGFYGLVPSITRPGDRVCVVKGLDVPFVFRVGESGQGEQGLRMVGEGFVHGLMMGEALGMVRSGNLAEETFSVF